MMSMTWDDARVPFDSRSASACHEAMAPGIPNAPTAKARTNKTIEPARKGLAANGMKYSPIHEGAISRKSESHADLGVGESSLLDLAPRQAGVGSLAQAGDQIDGDRDDHRAEQVGQQRVPQDGGPDRRRLQDGVGDLEGHPDGEGQVGEVGVPRRLVLVDVDAP